MDEHENIRNQNSVSSLCYNAFRSSYVSFNVFRDYFAASRQLYFSLITFHKCSHHLSARLGFGIVRGDFRKRLLNQPLPSFKPLFNEPPPYLSLHVSRPLSLSLSTDCTHPSLRTGPWPFTSGLPWNVSHLPSAVLTQGRRWLTF